MLSGYGFDHHKSSKMYVLKLCLSTNQFILRARRNYRLCRSTGYRPGYQLHSCVFCLDAIRCRIGSCFSLVCTLHSTSSDRLWDSRNENYTERRGTQGISNISNIVGQNGWTNVIAGEWHGA